MRKLKYKTNCGTYNTLTEVKGENYKTIFEEVKEKNAARSPMRQAMLDKFGMVSAKYKGMV